MTDGKEYLFTQTLDELADSLDPALFFRINRQYLISRKAVQDIDLWFNGRLAVNLIVPTLERILVSKRECRISRRGLRHDGLSRGL